MFAQPLRSSSPDLYYGKYVASTLSYVGPGLWYDPGDLRTLFQDAAGTTPVTGVGQPVGLMLDKSGRGNHAIQVTSTKRPILRLNDVGQIYLEPDGIDDFMSVASFDLRSTDKITVVAGVKKIRNTTALFVEHSTNFNGQPGSFLITAPENSQGVYSTLARGNAAYTGFCIPAPSFDRDVISFAHNFSGGATRQTESPILRKNGSDVAGVAIGYYENNTGNFGQYPFYLFSRAGSSFFFNGHFYGLIVVGKLIGESELKTLETYLNTRTKAF